MNDVLVPLVVSAAGGAIGAAVTYWFWLRQHDQEIRRSYDQELRTARFDAYRSLWREFEPLAVYLADRDVTYSRVVRLGIALRRWYFREGGLLLTERARNAYFLAQDAIDQVARAGLAEAVVRGADGHWTNAEVEHRRDALGLRPHPLDREPGRRAAWEAETEAAIRRWPFGADPDDDFVLLQYLASTVRTILASDLHARNPSILDRGGGRS